MIDIYWYKLEKKNKEFGVSMYIGFEFGFMVIFCFWLDFIVLVIVVGVIVGFFRIEVVLEILFCLKERIGF